MKKLTTLLLCLVGLYVQAQPQQHVLYGPFAKFTSVAGLNTCPTPNFKFGSSNIVWVEASTVSPATDNSVVTTIPNLVCSPNVSPNGSMRYFSTGGGSNNVPRVIETNNACWVGPAVGGTLFGNSNYTVMFVAKILTSTPVNGADDIFRGCVAAGGSIGNGQYSTDGAGNPSLILMQGDGAGFITTAYTDHSNYHVWTFIQSNNVGFVRRSMVQQVTGAVGNTRGWGTLDNNWSLFGMNFSGHASNMEWVRGLIWTNWLNSVDVTNYESICTNDFKCL